jgi:MscS family membrane protein
MPAFLAPYPRLTEALVSLLLLLASYVGARVVSFLLGELVARQVKKTATDLDDRLLGALKRPVTYSLFLVGAYAALLRLPIPPRWVQALHSLFFVCAVLLVALALIRSYVILLEWYARPGRTLNAGELAAEFRPLFSKLGKVFVGLLALIVVLQHFGVNVQSLVVSLGVGSLAVGLAAQDTLANMFAGFTIMLDRPFRVGDRIQLASGEAGDVVSIGMRATLIKTFDETLLVVPNSLLVKERLLNLSVPTRHLTTRVAVSVAHGSDLARVREILTAAALSSPHTDPERPPVVQITKLAEFSVHFLLVFWTKDYLEQGLATSAVNEEIHRRFLEGGIEMPVPASRVVQEEKPPLEAEEE